MGQNIWWAGQTQAFRFAKAFLLMWPDWLNVGNWICFAPKPEGILWGS